MTSLERAAIERKIRELSLQIEQELLAQQRERITQHINLTILDEMLGHWHKLAAYYEHNIYDKNWAEDIDTDTEMSLFLVQNYLEWTYFLPVYKYNATERGDTKEAEELDEARDSLEYAMKKILEAASDKDDLKL